MGLTLSVHPGDHGTTARVGGEIDVCVAEPLQDALLRIMRTHTPRLLLDLREVSFIDCAGLRALMLTRRRAALRGGSVHLIGASAAVRRVLDLAGLQDAFPICGPSETPMAMVPVRAGHDGGHDTWTFP